MPEPSRAEAEIELWSALIRAQQDYFRSLASLDALVFAGTNTNPWPTEWHVVEEAAQVRQSAYARYRQAMDQMTEFRG